MLSKIPDTIRSMCVSQSSLNDHIKLMDLYDILEHVFAGKDE